MAMARILTGAALLLVVVTGGCTTSPANYATTLSDRDPKWRSPQCAQIRVAAANYETGKKKRGSLARGLLLGPYGVGIALAIKQNEEKKRKLLARDMHMRCSSAPLPKELQIRPGQVANASQ